MDQSDIGKLTTHHQSQSHPLLPHRNFCAIMPFLFIILYLAVFSYSLLTDDDYVQSESGILTFSTINTNFMQWVRQHRRAGLPDYVLQKEFDPSPIYGRISGACNCREREICACRITDRVNRANSLHASELSFMSGPSTIDDQDLLAAVWVYLDKHDSTESKPRTVFSNKAQGCETMSPQHGLALYLNSSRAQQDPKLFVEFGSSLSGCHKLSSRNISLESARWYHIAVHASSKTTALYIDGIETNRVWHDLGHAVQKVNPFVVGAFNSEGQWPLMGNISQLALVHGVPSSGRVVQQLLSTIGDSINKAKCTPGIAALFPFSDAAHSLPFSSAGELIHHRNGTYTIMHAATVGVLFPGLKLRLVDGLDMFINYQEIGSSGSIDDEVLRSNERGRRRREQVKSGMKHAWQGYKRYAWGKDEVRPLSKRGTDNFGGMGATLVDSLDTLWVMGMHTEFEEAREWVAEKLTFNKTGFVSVFETTIRILGGLLSAYELSGHAVFLDRARELADKLMPAFNTQTGIPAGQVNFRQGRGVPNFHDHNATLAELGSLQIEFRCLAHHTKEPKYAEAAMRAVQVLHSNRPRHGLYPIRVSHRDGTYTDNQITLGALGDSFYEYLLKIWLQGGKVEHWLRDMYDRAIDGVVNKLLHASEPSNLAYLADWDGSLIKRHKMDHLVCFMPGTMALGAYTDPQGLQSPRAQRDLAVAKALMYTCREMYNRTTSGISAEYVEFIAGHAEDFIPGRNAQYFLLRPETAESLFYLHQLTGDPIYREWAWEIWQAIDSTCRTRTAYGTARNVSQPGGGGIDDRMESFFLAETLKYLYLVQDPDTEIDLMKYVFNTEAHPMKIFDDSHVPISPRFHTTDVY